jgi:hypothetical protein
MDCAVIALYQLLVLLLEVAGFAMFKKSAHKLNAILLVNDICHGEQSSASCSSRFSPRHHLNHFENYS